MTNNSNKSSQSPTRPVLTPSALGKYIGLDNCGRYFKFRIQETGFSELNHDQQAYVEAFRGGNIIEKQVGNDFEQQILEDFADKVGDVIDLTQLTLADAAIALPETTVKTLQEYGLTDTNSTITQGGLKEGEFAVNGRSAGTIPLTGVDADMANDLGVDTDQLESAWFQLREAYTAELIQEAVTLVSERTPTPSDIPVLRAQINKGVLTHTDRDHTHPIVIYQPTFQTDINGWTVAGEADLVLIWPATPPVTRVIDIKVANEEQTNHQLQTVTYSLAIEEILETNSDIQAGVLTQQDRYLPPTPETLPKFDRPSRITDLRQLTQEGGHLDRVVQQQFDETPVQLDAKCSSCQYNEACYTQAIESAGLELLGIDESTQQILHNHDVHDLNDLAAIAERPPDSPDPSNDSKPSPTRPHTQTYNALATNPRLGTDLPALIQQAQALLGNINPQHRRAITSQSAHHITNTGRGTLPDDNWNENWDEYADYRSGSMIRVYFNVQYDHIRDVIIGIAYHARATASNVDGISNAVFAEQMPDDTSSAETIEQNLLTDLFEDLLADLTTIADGIDFTEVDQDHPFLHFYVTSKDERDTLLERLANHDTRHNHGNTGTQQTTLTNLGQTQATTIESVRDLLTLKREPEESTFTAVLPDIKQRMALKTPTTGLINIYDQFWPEYRPEEAFQHTDWKAERPTSEPLTTGETTVDLTNAFDYRFFDRGVGYSTEKDSIQLLLEDNHHGVDGWYHSRVRMGAQIPLAYLWAAGGRLTNDWVERIKEESPRAVIEPYRYHNGQEQTTPILPSDVKGLMKRLAECLRHVEQGIPVKNRITTPDSPSPAPSS